MTPIPEHNRATPPNIIYLVMCVTAVAFLAFFACLIALLFTMPPGSPLWEKVFAALVTAGASVMSFFFGTLVNTRTAPQAENGENTTTTSTTLTAETITTPPSAPKE